MKQVKKFIKEFNITSENLNIKTLEEIIKNQGYEIYDFGADEEKVNAILKKLNLEEVSKSKNAFTYSSNTIKAIFINKNVGITERTELLLHEEIHIYLGHLNNTTLENEEEVLKFSIELKKQLRINNLIAWITIFSTVVIVIIILMTTNTNGRKNTIEPITTHIETTVTEEQVYITKNGGKYHKKNCYTIKNHEVIEISKEQAEQLYKPCKICYPED